MEIAPSVLIHHHGSNPASLLLLSGSHLPRQWKLTTNRHLQSQVLVVILLLAQVEIQRLHGKSPTSSQSRPVSAFALSFFTIFKLEMTASANVEVVSAIWST